MEEGVIETAADADQGEIDERRAEVRREAAEQQAQDVEARHQVEVDVAGESLAKINEKREMLRYQEAQTEAKAREEGKY